ncbi:MAG: fibronectin type III domain-containing protein, partial [bacterium]
NSPPITYDIYIALASGAFNWTLPSMSVAEPATHAQVINLNNGSLYYIAVRARDLAGLRNMNTTQLTVTPTDTVPPVFAGIQGAADDSSGGTVQISWNAATDASVPITYRIYYNTGAAIATWTQKFFVTSPAVSAIIEGLANGTQYAFAVRAEDKYGNIETNVVTATATPTDAIPPTFTGVRNCVDPGTGTSLTVSWSLAADKSSPITYNVYQATATNAFNFGLVNYSATDATHTTAIGLTMGTPYFFVAKAVDPGGNIGGSESAYYPNPDAVGYTPCIPTDGVNPVFAGLASATPTAESGKITLSWTAATDTSPPIVYNIYRSASTVFDYSSPTYQVTTATGTVISGLTNGTRYYFVVRAEDAGHRKETNTISQSAIPNDGSPPVFGGITGLVDKMTYGALTASWAAAADPSTPITYRIYVSTTPGIAKFSSPPYMSSTATTVDITGLGNNMRYYVGVRAEDLGGLKSANTEELFATTTDQAPPTFGGITSIQDLGKGGQLKIDWASAIDPSAPIYYLVYYSTGAGTPINYSTPAQIVQAHPLTLTGLQNAVLYNVGVRARDSASPANTDTNVVKLSATPHDVIPPTFAGIKTIEDPGISRAIKVTWLAAVDPTGPITYRIYYATSAVYSTIIGQHVKATATDTSYVVTGLNNGTAYYFVVHAVDGDSNEDTNDVVRGGSAQDCEPPVFAGLGAAVNSTKGNEVVLSWAAGTDETTPIKYYVYYTSGATTTLYNEYKLATTALAATITGLTNNTRYAFAVRSQDNNTYRTNMEYNTVILFATPTDQTPPIWTGLQSVTNSTKGNELILSWNAAADRTPPVYYNIYTSTTSHGQNFATPTYIVTATTSYHMTGLANGTRVYAVVTALDSSTYKNETSTATAEMSAIPTDATPPTFAGVSGVSIYSEDGKAKLEWSAASDRSPPIYYNIYRANISGAYSATPTYTVTATTTYIISGLVDGQYAYFRIRAKDSATTPNEDQNVVEKSIHFRDYVPPNEPTNVSAVAGDTSTTPGDEYITISWTPPTHNTDGSPLVDLAGYRIFRGTYSGQYEAQAITAPSTATSTKDMSGLVAGTRYYYVVVAKDDATPANPSPLSDEVSAIPLNADDAIPQPPDNVAAIASNGQVILNWRRPEFNMDMTPLNDLQGYKIYRGEVHGTYGLLVSNLIAPEVVQYIDTNVINEHTYYYVLTSVDSSDPPNESGHSSEVTGKPGIMPDFPPSAPTNLRAVVGTGSNYLTWSPPTTNSDGSPISDLAGYYVYRSENCGASDTIRVNALPVSTPSMTDSTGIVSGKQYTYYVTAIDQIGQQSASSTQAVAISGTKGVTGTLLYRDMTLKDNNGYVLRGVACLEINLVDGADAKVATGYTSGDGSFKIVYDAAVAATSYKVRLVVHQGDGYPYTKMTSGTGYLVLGKPFNITTGFTSMPTLSPIGVGPAVGDANCDGMVSIKDMMVIRSSFNALSSDPRYNVNADFNGDSLVSLKDLMVMKSYFNMMVDPKTPSPCQ